ncbi:EamA family transporter [Baekduia soli]|uniref:EamA family transporter n=1 Tax=Baekduia soli TaxID=496014 RepID=UPI00165290FE|nr:EamA family transporter [Baekduia soli]
MLAAVSWGLGSFTSLRITLPGDPLVATAWQLLFGGLVLTVAGACAGEGLHPSAFSATSLAALAYLVLVGSIVAFSCYAYALAHAPISKVSTYAYVNPLIAVVLGAVFLDERITIVTIAGMALIVASVVVVVRHEARRTAAVRAGAAAEAA